MTMRIDRRRLLALGLAAGVVAARRVAAQTGTPVGGEIGERLAAVVRPYVASGQFSGALLVVHRGETLLRDGYGTANGITGAANTPATAYQIASLTKGFTALACVQLQEAGKLALDDPITTYLPEVVHASRDGVAITIRHLLNHTAGIPDFIGFYDLNNPLTYPRTRAKLLADILAHELDFTPGTRFAYSSSGYILAGLIVERVSGSSYEAYLKAKIFGPAGMADSFIVEPPDPAPPDSKGYAVVNGLRVAVSDFDRVDLLSSAGGISSTVDDLRRWHEALLTEKLAPRAAIEAMYARGLGDYGLGWEIGEIVGHAVVGHEGHTIGYDANLARFLEDDALIVLLSNAQDAPELEIVTKLTETLFG
jgi:CubicO group peptidase (beta-lactamase class C family)